MRRQVNALLVGWYGAGNVGDELLLDIMRDWLAQEDAALTVLSIDPVHTTKHHGLPAVDLFDLTAVASAMRQADLLVLGGGGLLHTYNRFGLSSLYGFDTFDITAYVRSVLLARQMGVKTALIAQGVGPLEGLEAKSIVADVFTHADYATLRDEASCRLLQEVGVDRKLAFAPDAGWSVTVNKEALPATRDELRIGVVTRPWSFVEGWEDRFVDAIKHCAQGRRITLVWLPFQSHAVPGRSASDVLHARNLMERIGDVCEHELHSPDDWRQVTSTFGSCHGVICMRLHAQVLALKVGRPAFCMEYDGKMSAASMMAGVPDGARLDLHAAASVWNESLCNWLGHCAEGSAWVDEQRVQELSEQADHHRSVLRAAVNDVRMRGEAGLVWKSGQFDWLGVWREQHVFSKIDEAAGLLTRVTSQLRTDQASLQQQLAEMAASRARRDAELSQFLHELSNRTDMSEATHKKLANDVAVRDRLDENMHFLLQKLEERTVELEAIWTSNSWRLTRPIRFLRRLISNPRATFPIVASHKNRYRWSVAADGRDIPSKAVKQSKDLAWAQFEHQVLANRSRYKGVFIQELVIDWNVPLYQRPQHLAAALARRGYLVIYKTDNWSGDDVNGFREVYPSVWLTNDKSNVDAIGRAVRSVYSTAYLHTPKNLEKLPHDGSIVYEYIDHIDPQISGDPVNIQRLVALKNWAFRGGADYVAVSARILEAEAVAEMDPRRVILVPNGVDTNHYRDAVHQDTNVPDGYRDFREKYRTVVGYFGAIAPWLWYEEIRVLVESRPDLGFVFIGPDYYNSVERLVKAENVLYLGTVDYKILPAYAQLFDVCFIPFEPGEIARTTSPLKLFEYFALEKPVVVTSEMLECTAYSEVLKGDSAQSLSIAIDQAVLQSDSVEYRARLRQLADENDWDHRATSMESAFKELGSFQAGEG